MLMQRIEAETDWAAHVAVSLLRRWAALRLAGDAPWPGLVALAAKLGTSPVAAVALGSVFQLTEACLGRPLKIERCCDSGLGWDERAVVHMLGAAPPAASPPAEPEGPAGLSRALASAIASARRLLADRESRLPAPEVPHCPLAWSSPASAGLAAASVEGVS